MLSFVIKNSCAADRALLSDTSLNRARILLSTLMFLPPVSVFFQNKLFSRQMDVLPKQNIFFP